MTIAQRAIRALLPPPVQVRHAEYSMILSADDEPNRPSPRLLDVALDAVSRARTVSMQALSARMPQGILYAEVWPGEHYKLLAGLMQAIQPRIVVEIGTATGLSAVAMKQFMPPGATVHTFDIVPWKQYPGTVLTSTDMADGGIVQHLDDLQDPTQVTRHQELLQEADFIFMDAAKDGVMEQRFISNLLPLRYRRSPIVMFDDIRVWNMLRIWRDLPRPKLDLTSFGHWSGTGLVDWSPRAS